MIHELKNHRFIHLKNEFSKFFGNLVMGAAKETLVESMSKFQIGTRTGHRAQEHIYTIKNCAFLLCQVRQTNHFEHLGRIKIL